MNYALSVRIHPERAERRECYNEHEAYRSAAAAEKNGRDPEKLWKNPGNPKWRPSKQVLIHFGGRCQAGEIKPEKALSKDALWKACEYQGKGPEVSQKSVTASSGSARSTRRWGIPNHHVCEQGVSDAWEWGRAQWAQGQGRESRHRTGQSGWPHRCTGPRPDRSHRMQRRPSVPAETQHGQRHWKQRRRPVHLHKRQLRRRGPPALSKRPEAKRFFRAEKGGLLVAREALVRPASHHRGRHLCSPKHMPSHKTDNREEQATTMGSPAMPCCSSSSSVCLTHTDLTHPKARAPLPVCQVLPEHEEGGKYSCWYIHQQEQHHSCRQV